MPEFLIPTYVQPGTQRHFNANMAVRRWLVDLGEDGGGPLPAAIDRLASRLRTSPDRIQAIMDEATFESWLENTLIDLFEPVPHETEARQQLVRLARTTWELPPPPGGGRLFISPRSVEFCLGTIRPPLPGDLAAEWRDWAAAWAEVVARNPALELYERMNEVFHNDAYGPAFGWIFGKERWIYEWLARGTRDPMPFTDDNGIITEAYYSRLCELRDLAGGWWCYDENVKRLRFVSAEEWQTMSASLDRPPDWAWAK